MVTCSYCDIAYATDQPNCRGCGAPKTADAVRRDLEIQSQSMYFARPTRSILVHIDEEPPSALEILLRRGPGTIACIMVALPLSLMMGPVGFLVLLVMLPKLISTKSQ